MFKQLIVVVLLVFSFSVNADVVKWVDSKGRTHYSNKAPKQHKKSAQKIKFTQYKKPEKIEVVVVPAVDWSKDFQQVGSHYVPKVYGKKHKSRQRKPRKQKELSIVELRAQCDIAREKRLAPARAEAIQACILKNERQTKNVVAYCERFNRTFGDEQQGGYYVKHHRRAYPYVVETRRQRLFHNIPECKRLYRAEDKLSRLNRGYRN